MDGVEQRSEPSHHTLLLQASQLGRRSAEHVLLEDICLEIYAGDRLAIVGPTGSGKSLLLRSLAMLDPLDGGEIRWRGATVTGSDIPMFRSHAIYLHQRPALMEGTVEDNLRQPFALHIHRDKQFNRPRMVALLESLGRGDSFLSKQQRDLSGGESQITALLRAMQLDPNILLLDEPTAALDAVAAQSVESLVRFWLNEQPSERAALWVTHDHPQAQRVSTSVLQIRDGRLI